MKRIKKENVNKGIQFEYTEWMNIVEDNLKSQGDRALVLVCTSILEVQLENLLIQILINGKNVKGDLFGGNSAIATLSSKITMCYYLGIISEHERKTIDTLRKIRNTFAHEIKANSFEDIDSIRDKCKNLSIPEGMYLPDDFGLQKNKAIVKFDTNPYTDDTCRTRFIKVFKYITRYLEIRKIEIGEKECVPFHAKSVLEQYEFIADTYIKQEQRIEEQVEEFESLQKRLEATKENAKEELLKCKERKREMKKSQGSSKGDLQDIERKMEECDAIEKKYESIIEKSEKALEDSNREKVERGFVFPKGMNRDEFVDVLQKTIETIKVSYEQ